MTRKAPARAERLARLGGLYAIVGDDDPVARAAAAVDGGARVVQVRMKRTPAGAVLEAARRIVELAHGRAELSHGRAALARERALVLVNDRPDIAVLAGADGVHLGDEDLPPAEARAIVGPDLLVGRTCRSAKDALAALADGADHLGYGPVFASLTKPLAVGPFGLAALAEVCAAVPAPVVAISGITLANIADVARAGAAAAAVIGDLFDAGDPRARASALAAAFEVGRAGRPGRAP
ncbi:MAG: thiamine phosphate synthase [Anaeromyxobacteraceae bacterium]